MLTMPTRRPSSPATGMRRKRWRTITEVAFDFRADNPSAIKDKREAASPLKSHYYRTVGGHVLPNLAICNELQLSPSEMDNVFNENICRILGGVAGGK